MSSNPKEDSAGCIVCKSYCEYKSDKPNQPCWGRTSPVDNIKINEEWVWVHACEGHAKYPDYTPEGWKKC